MTRIDLRESILDFPSQSIITRDNVEIQVHPMVLYRIAEPIRAVYEVCAGKERNSFCMHRALCLSFL